MPTILTQCSVEMYVDDTLLYTYGKYVNKIKYALNNDLKQLKNWLSVEPNACRCFKDEINVTAF